MAMVECAKNIIENPIIQKFMREWADYVDRVLQTNGIQI